VVVVVGTTTGVVVVVAGAGGAVVVGTVAGCVDVSAVAAVFAAAPTGAVVVVDRAVDLDADADADADAERDEAPVPRAPCESLDCALAIPCAPPRTMRFGLPAVATSNAISARETARMTHQLGRPRATLGRRPSEDPVP
jgi:hypothetical protein